MRFAFLGIPDADFDAYFLLCRDKGLDLHFLTSFDDALRELANYRFQCLIIQRRIPFFRDIFAIIKRNPVLAALPRLVLCEAGQSFEHEYTLNYPLDEQRTARTLKTIVSGDTYVPLRREDIAPYLLHIWLSRVSGRMILKNTKGVYALYFVAGRPWHIRDMGVAPARLSERQRALFTAETLLPPKAFLSYLISKIGDLRTPPTPRTLVDNLLHLCQQQSSLYSLKVFEIPEHVLPPALDLPRYPQCLLAAAGHKTAEVEGKIALFPQKTLLSNALVLLPNTRDILRYAKNNYSLQALESNVALESKLRNELRNILLNTSILVPFTREGTVSIPQEQAVLIDAYLPVVYTTGRRHFVSPATALATVLIAVFFLALAGAWHYRASLIPTQKQITNARETGGTEETGEILFGKAEEAFAQRDYLRAISFAETAASRADTQERRLEALLLVSRAALERRDFSTAERALEDVKALAPKEPRLYLYLGNLSLDQFRVNPLTELREATIANYRRYIELADKPANKEMLLYIIETLQKR